MISSEWVPRSPAWPLLLSIAAPVCATEYYRMVFGKLPREAWAGLAAAASLPLLPDAVPDLAAWAAFWIALNPRYSFDTPPPTNRALWATEAASTELVSSSSTGRGRAR